MMKPRITSVFAQAAMMMLLTMTAQTAWADSSFSGGDGSQNNPYQMKTIADLNQLATDVNDGTTYSNTYFKLMNDIDFNDDATLKPTKTWNDATNTENNYTAIGTNSHPFKGIFDGDGKTIKGIRIYKGGSSGNTDGYQGLFGKIGEGAQIIGVTLDDARITGQHYVGGIVGYNEKATISNCHVTATVDIHTVQGYCNDHGGIVGSNKGDNNGTGATITGCTSSVTLTIADNIVGSPDFSSYGGIAGGNSRSTISGCLVIGATVPSVTRTSDNQSYYGAITGYHWKSTLENNYYLNCTIAGTPNATGVGCGTTSGIFDATDNNGALSLHTLTLGDGITTTTPVTITISGNGYYAQSTTIALSGGLPDASACTAGYTAGYTTTAGTINRNPSDGTFTLTMPADDATIGVTTTFPIDWATEGRSGDTADDAYFIYNRDQLDMLAQRVNSGTSNYSGKFFKLGADITYTYDANTQNNYTPIGGFHNSVQHSFNAVFDGNGKKISGIRINADSYIGLFGIIGYGAIINGITLIDASIQGTNTMGGIVGEAANEAIVSNCFCFNVTVTYTKGTQHGVIVGHNTSNILTNNYYRNCQVGSATTNIGSNGADVTENNGALSLHTLTLGEGITATPATITYDGTKYYAQGLIVALSGPSIPEGKYLCYIVSAGTVSGNATDGFTLTMPATDVTVNAHIDYWTGTGDSEADPYQISTCDDLDKLALLINNGTSDFSGKYFKQMNDIVYTHTTAWNDATSAENNYTAIGNDLHHFDGTFDGDGHTISGIRIYKGGNNNSFDSYQGLFGYVSGTVKNVTLANARITGYSNVGGIVGELSYATVSGCRVAADVALHAVQNDADSFGGIVGYSNKSSVSGCTSAVKIAVKDGLSKCARFGGIVGCNIYVKKDNFIKGTITGCQAIGVSVAASNKSGAIVGYYNVSGTSDNPMSGNTYHSCLVGTNAFNIGVGDRWGNKGDATGASLDATAFCLDDRIDNTALIAAYADPASHTANNGTAPDFSNLSVTLHDRTFWKDMAWNTICLPFSMTAEQVTAQLAPAALKELDITGTYEGKQTGLDGTTLYLYFKDATSIEAGKPYIIKWDGDGTNNLVNPVFSGVTISNTTPMEITFIGGKFVGSYSPVDFAANDKSILYLGAANKLYWPNAAMTLGACRAHFELTDGQQVGAIRLNFDDDATSIKSLTPDPSPTGEGNFKGEGSDYWYTLSGTHLSTQPTKPGLYIHNGHKVVIK